MAHSLPIFCGIRISPKNQLKNDSFIDSNMLDMSKRLRVQKFQKRFAEARV